MVKVETDAPTAGVDVAVPGVQKPMPHPTTTQLECKSYRPVCSVHPIARMNTT